MTNDLSSLNPELVNALGPSIVDLSADIDKSRLLESLLRDSHDAITIQDLHGVVQYWSVGAQRLLGYQASQVLGKNIRLTIPPDGIAVYDNAIRDLSNNLSVNQVEIPKLTQDDRRIIVQLSAGPITDHVGNHIGYFTLERDITQFKTNEEILKKTINDLSDQAWLYSGSSNLSVTIRGDQSVEKLTKTILYYTSEYINAQAGSIYVCEDDGSLRLYATLTAQNALKEHRRFALGEGLIGQVGETQKMVVLHEIPDNLLTIDAGLCAIKPKTIIIVPILNEGELRGVMEFASYKEFTPKHLRFLEVISEVVGISLTGAMQRDKINSLLEEAQSQAEELRVQQDDLRALNEELEEQTSMLKLSELKLKEQKEELVKINEELMEERQALKLERDREAQRNHDLLITQNELQVKSGELAIANEYKSQFLANMSHELRTPLNSLLILAEILIKNEQQHLCDEEVNYAKTIHGAGIDLLELIEDILEISKIEAGKVDLNTEAFSIGDYTREVHSRFVALAKRKGLNFTIETGFPQDEILSTDRRRLDQIVKNLLSNALKFTDRGGFGLKIYQPEGTETGLDPSTIDTMIAFSVWDEGIGIPENKREIIFDAFEQVDGTTSRKYGGSGLGLSIARQLSKLLGGKITLTSEIGKGSMFTLYVPRTLASAQNSAGPAEAKERHRILPIYSTSKSPETQEPIQKASQPKSAESEKSVLIIEDDQPFAEIIATLAKQRGFHTYVAHDGNSGLQLAREHRPRAIILDLRLPDIDGFSIMARLKHDPLTRKIPVQVVSSADNIEDVMELGAIGYLRKPINQESVATLLAELDKLTANQTKRLMIIEDNEHQRNSIIALFRDKNVEICACETGQDALAKILQSQFDCIILDLNLPDTTGFKFLRDLSLQESAITPPIVIYTGHDLSRDEETQLREYSQAIIIKGPYSIERLVSETELFLNLIQDHIDKEKDGRIVYEDIFANKRVLLVDDDMRTVYALSALLRKEKIIVEIARSGIQALEKLENGDIPDLVLLDIMMPEMDGYETMRRIRANFRLSNIPIIALTAKAMKDDRKKCLDAGASDYLAKPIQAEVLFSLMQVWLHT